MKMTAFSSRAFHGRVDRNYVRGAALHADREVAPFTGAWIETQLP